MQTTRRTFLSTTAAVPAAGAIDPKSPNDRIAIGLIGAGGRGTYLLNEIAKARENNVVINAVCDVYRPHLDRGIDLAMKAFGIRPQRTSDYRELLAWKDIDAVVIASPDFTHSQILHDAVEAGKDAYCEKPMGTSFVEAKRAWLAVQRTDRIVQIGTQRRSDPGHIAASRLLRAGLLGKVTRVEMAVHFQEARWRRSYDGVTVEDLDWNRFQFGRANRPFNPRRFRQWQLFRDYTNGIPGLWMSHFIDLVPWFLNTPYPSSAVSSGGVYFWKDGRETEDVFYTLLEYPEDLTVSFAMTLTNSEGSRNLWYGSRGTFDADALRITGAGSKESDRIEREIEIKPEAVESHMANFLRSMRSRQKPRACIDAGFSHAVAGCMAAEALRTGRRVTFNDETCEMG
ncbi:MAG: Gfo/Idh/MocA family oxidoreductase [Acidobacteria bacterium]|nr:Gfo/Idh/MocA family oxidoreductase [Acidobacteriota bacterium]